MKKKGCLIPVLVVLISFIVLLVVIMKTGMNNVETSDNTSNNKTQIIFDAEKYSRMTKENLISDLGEPASTEDWTNKTSRGDFEVTTLSYDINLNHYEFIIADDSVVRLSIYSNAYWNSEGDRFAINGGKEDICKSFNITLGENVKRTTDNNITYTLSPVNDKVAMFDVQDISSNTYGFVKITYNLNYFD